MSKVIHRIFIPTFIAPPRLLLWNFVLSHIASGLLPYYEYSDICRLLDFHLDIFFNPLFFHEFFSDIVIINCTFGNQLCCWDFERRPGNSYCFIHGAIFCSMQTYDKTPHCELHLYFSLTKFKSKNFYMPLDLFVVHVLFSMGAFGCLQQEMTAISGCMKQMLLIKFAGAAIWMLTCIVALCSCDYGQRR